MLSSLGFGAFGFRVWVYPAFGFGRKPNSPNLRHRGFRVRGPSSLEPPRRQHGLGFRA